ncbi:MAG: glutaredoxin [Myxococcaceae bacterium]|nr:glutaredoxin [Myxococcaceae bacterium]
MNGISPRIQGPGVTRNILDPRRITPEALQRAAAFHAEIVRAVEQAAHAEPVLVVGMAQNPFVKKVRKALQEAGIAFKYLEYGSYLSRWKERLAIKLWSGWATFPQVFVRGVLIGGYRETVQALADGSFKRLQVPVAVDPREIQA